MCLCCSHGVVGFVFADSRMSLLYVLSTTDLYTVCFAVCCMFTTDLYAVCFDVYSMLCLPVHLRFKFSCVVFGNTLQLCL